MTPTEWDEIVEWVNQRWPNGWRGEQDVAYYEDLNSFDASDVWSALFAIYGEGLAFPPNGSMITAKLTARRKDQARQARYNTPALPEPERKTVGSWLEKRYPNEQVSWTEHIRRIHAKGKPCKSRLCDIHVLANKEEER